ncbi:hypothetical protein FB446DRAFT_795100 [Lentinula raphanica]|nr:hypothetical protein FB446DRAFT_795100 [Lentinula raphanica]
MVDIVAHLADDSNASKQDNLRHLQILMARTCFEKIGHRLASILHLYKSTTGERNIFSSFVDVCKDRGGKHLQKTTEFEVDEVTAEFMNDNGVDCIPKVSSDGSYYKLAVRPDNVSKILDALLALGGCLNDAYLIKTRKKSRPQVKAGPPDLASAEKIVNTLGERDDSEPETSDDAEPPNMDEHMSALEEAYSNVPCTEEDVQEGVQEGVHT